MPNASTTTSAGTVGAVASFQHRTCHAARPLRIAACIDRRLDRRQRIEPIEPERHVEAVLGRKESREPPRHAGVAEIVDDAAEDVPAQGH
jgi:hypothetical protein